MPILRTTDEIDKKVRRRRERYLIDIKIYRFKKIKTVTVNKHSHTSRLTIIAFVLAFLKHITDYKRMTRQEFKTFCIDKNIEIPYIEQCKNLSNKLKN